MSRARQLVVVVLAEYFSISAKRAHILLSALEEALR